MRSALGQQNIRVAGVPADSHFAQVLIEADYRMKADRHWVGKAGRSSWPAMSTRPVLQAATANQMQRVVSLFFPTTNAFRVTADDLGMELTGNGVKLVNENEMVFGRWATRHVSNRSEQSGPSSLSKAFTRKYPEIAAKNPGLRPAAQTASIWPLRAAFLQAPRLLRARQAWKMETFGR